ncbi:MAG: hypothetical protein WDN28_33965 [Chthoniobacter sp.]
MIEVEPDGIVRFEVHGIEGGNLEPGELHDGPRVRGIDPFGLQICPELLDGKAEVLHRIEPGAAQLGERAQHFLVVNQRGTVISSSSRQSAKGERSTVRWSVLRSRFCSGMPRKGPRSHDRIAPEIEIRQLQPGQGREIGDAIPTQVQRVELTAVQHRYFREVHAREGQRFQGQTGDRREIGDVIATEVQIAQWHVAQYIQVGNVVAGEIPVAPGAGRRAAEDRRDRCRSC